ncbi:MAG TPA: hypothetical protein VEO54_16675, partial [Thermoanaerobaculia bacterium]|nr:hypothetical protein [Thermoanaerobaculia bacterium]
HVPRAPSIVISHNSYGVQFEKHLRFLSNERLLYPVVTPARSYSIEPLDRGWELRIFDLTREREETVPSVRAVPPTHSLLCYTKDGAHFVTYSHYDKTLAIWPIAAGGASLRLRRIRPEHLASYAAIFRQASRVRAAEPDTVAADLADGVTISIAPAGVTARREGETWRISALPPAVAEEKSLREPQQELTPDGRLWVVHGSAYVEWPDKAPGWLGIRDVSTGVAVARWLWHDSHVIGTTFLDEGRQLVTVAASGTVRRWFLDVAADDDRIRLSNAGEALTGMRIGDAGIASPLPPTELAAVREAEPRTAAERLLHARLRITLRP